jgi:hypothetical protein
MFKKRLNLRNVVKIGVASLAVCMMFSGCKKDKDGNTGLAFGTYSLPAKMRIYHHPDIARTGEIIKVGNDYYSSPAGVLTTQYFLRFDPATKTWQEYSKPYTQNWSSGATYTEETVKARLKHNDFFGFVLSELDNTGFNKGGYEGVEVAVHDQGEDWRAITRTATIYSNGTTKLYVDNEYGIVLKTEGSLMGLQRISYININASFGNISLPQ